jgi:trimeric autotransporter adhesin
VPLKLHNAVRNSLSRRVNGACNSSARKLAYTLLLGLFFHFAGRAQTVTLSATPATGQPGNAATFNISLSAGGTQPTALQWTMGYSPAAISGISVAVAGTAAAAGDSVTCANGFITVTCVVAGNQNVIADGVIAQVTATLSSSTVDSSTAISVSGVMAATQLGASIPSAATGTQVAIVFPVVVSALTCSPGALIGAGAVSCTVGLNNPAPAGGLPVSLASSSANLVVPASVTVPAGTSGASFVAQAVAVNASEADTITATTNGGVQSASISLLAIQGSSLTCNPANVAGAVNVTCTISLNGGAAAGGLAVGLTSNSASLVVPASVTVPAGSNGASFVAQASAVNATVTAVVTAAANGSSPSASVTLVAIVVSALACNPATMTGAGNVSCTVTLNGGAPAGGLAVGLTSSSANLVVPASVTVPAGSNNTTFAAQASAVNANVTAVITAAANGSSPTASILLTPIILVSSLTCNPAAMTGAGAVSCTVSLNGVPGAGGLVVGLAGNAASVTGPASVTVPAGSNSASFTAQVSAVSANATVVITATANGSSQTASIALTASPILVSGLTCTPAAMSGAGTVNCTISLNGVAPAGGLAVTLTSSSASLVVPATVTVSAGASSASVAAQASAVSANVTAVVTASANSSSQTASIALSGSSMGVTALACNPSSVVSGSSTTCTVTISTAAPASGAVASLTANGTALSIPASVTIAAGASSGTFSAKASGLTGESVEVAAAMDGTSKTVSITVKPFVTLAILGSSAEVSGKTNGSTVKPAVAPSGFGGHLVVRGTGSVNFAENSSGDGVYFLNCCAGANNADYKFTGTTIGQIFNQSQGEINFSLTSRYSFAERSASTTFRAVFDVRDGNDANHVFYFFTQAYGGRLIFTYAIDSVTQQYYVPQGTEDTLFGAGVTLNVAIVWQGGTAKLYLNGTLVQTSTYAAKTADWTSASNFDLGAFEDLTYGGYDSCDDTISLFTVGPIQQQ